MYDRTPAAWRMPRGFGSSAPPHITLTLTLTLTDNAAKDANEKPQTHAQYQYM